MPPLGCTGGQTRSKMVGDSRQRLKMSGDGRQQLKMLGDSRQQLEMFVNGCRWPTTVGDGRKQLKTAGEVPEVSLGSITRPGEVVNVWSSSKHVVGLANVLYGLQTHRRTCKHVVGVENM
jgi:hypothetical protein